MTQPIINYIPATSPCSISKECSPADFWLSRQWRRLIVFTEDIGSSYRSTIFSQAFLSLGVLLINLLVLIIGITVYPVSQQDGTGTIYAGNCKTVQKANSAAHLMINLLSTTILSASNYCMQCLVAPTRPEVDKAHSRRNTVDIAVQSITNLRCIPWPRTLVWLLLALSSVPLHLLYNSSVFKTETGIEYDIVIVQEEFLNQRGINSTTGKTLADEIPEGMAFVNYEWDRVTQDKAGKTAFDLTVQRFAIEGRGWKNMTTTQCISAYAQDFVTQYSTLLLVTKDKQDYVKPMANGTFIFWDFAIQNPRSYSWMCERTKGNTQNRATCDPKEFPAGKWTIELTRDDFLETYPVPGPPELLKIDIEYCLAEPAQQYCELKYSRTILITVCIMNIVKAACMFYIAMIGWTDEPILTVGDAVSSFLQEPDEYTKGLHDWTRKDFKKWQRKRHPNGRKGSHRRWINGASKTKWIWCMCLSFLVLSFTGLMMDIAVSSFFYGIPKKDWWRIMMKSGVGNFTPMTVISGFEWASTPIYAVVIANSPQLVLSFLYLQYNSIFTSMLAEREWTAFGLRPSRLRVSFPKPGQGRTRWLQLPYRWGIPLGMLSFLLHWLVSEAIYFAQMTTLLGDIAASLPLANRIRWVADTTQESIVEARNGGGVVGSARSVVGYSVMGIGLSMIVGFSALLVALLIGVFKKYPGELPLGGTCSAVVSAACHGETRKDSAFRPVRWGDTTQSEGTGAKGFYNVSEENFMTYRQITRQQTTSGKAMEWMKRKVFWK